MITDVKLQIVKAVVFALLCTSAYGGEQTQRQLSCYATNLKPQKFPVHFFLSSHRANNQRLTNGRTDKSFLMDGTGFDGTQRTTVIIHGYLSRHNEPWINQLRNELLEWNENMNVIAMDWKKGFPNAFDYVQAAFNTQHAAERLKNFTAQIAKKANSTLLNFHFVGFDLGAHVAGQAAAALKSEKGLTVSRVTALDPIEPCFAETGISLRLNKSCAEFVDVIHTDSSLEYDPAYGIREPIGHMDFYPNFGVDQPGCFQQTKKPKPRSVLDVEALIRHIIIDNGQCSHNRAFQYFLDSVKQENNKECKFWAHPWRLDMDSTKSKSLGEQSCEGDSSCVEMGIRAEVYKNQPGIYFLSTTKNSPFCKTKVVKTPLIEKEPTRPSSASNFTSLSPLDTFHMLQSDDEGDDYEE